MQTLEQLESRLNALAARMEGQAAPSTPKNAEIAQALGYTPEKFNAMEGCRLAVENLQEAARQARLYRDDLDTSNLERLASEAQREMSSFTNL